MELETPLLLILNSLRSVLSHLCVRGLKHVNDEDLAILRDAAVFFHQCDATYFAEHIENFLISRESDPAIACRQLLELQSRVLLFERQFSRQTAIEALG